MQISRLPLYENDAPGWRKLFSKRYSTAIFSILLLLVRMLHTGNQHYSSMGWNLLLAFIPLLISSCMLYFKVLQKRTLYWVTLGIVWLLFLPNAPYMLTDLYHLPEFNEAPMWFDLILLLSFAWTGLIWANRSLHQMEKIWVEKFPRFPLVYFTGAVIFLCGLGVYVGRYWRWNSWYVLSEPITILRGLEGLIFHPFAFREAWAFSICLAGLLWVMYPFMKKIA